MVVSCRKRAEMALVVAAGVGLLTTGWARAQQNPYDLVVFHNASNDSNATATTFTTGVDGSGAWTASVATYSLTPYTNATPLTGNTAPTPGYAYVDTNPAQVRTPTGAGPITFAGDSLAFLPSTAPTAASILASGQPTCGLFIKSPAGTSITVADLILGNGGAVLNFNNLSASLNGGIYLVAAGTSLDGTITTASGGIIDERGGTQGLTVNSTITGPGQLHVIQSGGNGPSFLTLTASNSFSGGVNLDSSIYSANLPSPYPLLKINNPSALGTGTFTITGASNGGPEFDNTTGAPETLSTNNPMAWNTSGFTFLGSNSLDMGNGPIALGANVTVNAASHALSLEGAISGSYGLTKTGSGTLLLNGTSTYTGATNVSGGTLGGIGEIAALVNILSGGTLAPGQGPGSPGTLTVESALNLSSGSTLSILLNGSTPDEIVAEGTVNLFGSTLSLALAPGYMPAIGQTFTIIDNQSALGTSGLFSNDVGGFVTDTAGDTFSVNYAAVADGDGQANDVTLTFVSPVPEPASLGVLGVSALVLSSRRRRRLA